MADVAVTPEEQRMGLNGRASLPPNMAMLFPLSPNPGTAVAFSLQETRFPLDILWIGQDNRVIGVVHNAPPLSRWVYRAPPWARYVLELAGSTAQPYGVTPGAFVRELHGERLPW